MADAMEAMLLAFLSTSLECEWDLEKWEGLCPLFLCQISDAVCSVSCLATQSFIALQWP